MYKSEHLPDGESFGEGDLLFSSPHCKPPPLSFAAYTLHTTETLVWLAAFAWCEISLCRTSRA